MSLRAAADMSRRFVRRKGDCETHRCECCFSVYLILGDACSELVFSGHNAPISLDWRDFYTILGDDGIYYGASPLEYALPAHFAVLSRAGITTSQLLRVRLICTSSCGPHHDADNNPRPLS